MESEVRRLGADFARDAVSAAWDALDGPDEELLKGIFAKAAAAGVLSFIVPEACGGSGLGAVDCAAFVEEVARECGGAAYALASHFAGVAPFVLEGGDRFAGLLSKVAEGEGEGRAVKFAAAVREESGPGFCDDGVDTVVEVTGGRAVVRGCKRCVVCGGDADYFAVLARDGDVFRWVAVPRCADGVAVKGSGARIGLRCCPVYDVEFAGAEVAEDDVSEGFSGFGRVLAYHKYIDPVVAAVAIGVGRAAREAAFGYSLERYQGGKIISGHDTVRGLLGGMDMKLRSARSLAYGPVCGYLGSASAAGAAEEICLDAIQVFGGYGYMKDYRIERYLRDVKALRAVVQPDARMRRNIAGEIEGGMC